MNTNAEGKRKKKSVEVFSTSKSGKNRARNREKRESFETYSTTRDLHQKVYVSNFISGIIRNCSRQYVLENIQTFTTELL